MEPVKFVAVDRDDLEVVSTHLQDALVKVCDVLWRPQEKRVVVALSRFDWLSAEGTKPELRRCRSALRFERVLGCGGTLGQHDRDRLADIADFVMGNDRLLERREGRRGILPQRNYRHCRAEIGRGDDGVHAGALARGGGVDGADTSVRHRAAQDHRVQQVFAREIVDELAASAQQPPILDAFDRAADEHIGPALLVHAQSVIRQGGQLGSALVLRAWPKKR